MFKFLFERNFFSRTKNLTYFFLDFILILLKLDVARKSNPIGNFLFILYKLIKFFSLKEISPYFFVFLVNFIKCNKFSFLNNGFISKSNGYLFFVFTDFFKIEVINFFNFFI